MVGKNRLTPHKKSILSAFYENLANVPTIYRRAEPLRKAFLDIISTHQLAYTENIRHPDLWIVYPFYVSLIKRFILLEISLFSTGEGPMAMSRPF